MPFLHFFDGFRTSHEVDKIALLEEDDLRALVDDEAVLAHRRRGLTPDAPVLRGSAQNPDVFFQAREACNPYYDAVPAIVETVFRELAERSGREYGLVDYVGAPDAERVVVLMGSAAGAAEEAVEVLTAAGEPVGLLKVRLYRPFPASQLVRALPPTVRSVAVLDRTKEPGATGEPLLLDVLASLHDAMDSDAPAFAAMPHVIGGRYGLSSKELRPAHIKAVFDELAKFDDPAAPRPKRRFTVGILDDVTHLSLDVDESFRSARPEGEVQAMFFGLGADGTVGANKASVKIIGEHTDLHAQGYFVYDSKKSGSVTVSHLRFGPDPIRSTYLIEDADFVACHQFGLLEKLPVLDHAKRGATVLLNAPYAPDEVWAHLPAKVQRQIVEQELAVWTIDAHRLAKEHGLGTRINTIMQPCFFALAGVLPADEAMAQIKASVEHSYGRAGGAVVAAQPRGDRRRPGGARPRRRALGRRPRPARSRHAAGGRPRLRRALHRPPDRRRRRPAPGVRAAGRRHLPDGHGPVREAQRSREELPIWDPDICIDCGKCAIVCPHATIRMKVYEPAALVGAPGSFLSKDFRSKDIAGYRMTIQVAPDDCTGCGICVDVCPAKSKTEVRHKALNMEPAAGAPRRRAPVVGLLPHPSRARPRAAPPRHASRARRCCSRCSSSPAPAPAAARRPTSSWPRSCSATAWSSPTPPVARPSTAATSRRRRGR